MINRAFSNFRQSDEIHNSPPDNLSGLTIDACYVSMMELDLIAHFQQLFVTISLIFHLPRAIKYDTFSWPFTFCWLLNINFLSGAVSSVIDLK